VGTEKDGMSGPGDGGEPANGDGIPQDDGAEEAGPDTNGATGTNGEASDAEQAEGKPSDEDTNATRVDRHAAVVYLRKRHRSVIPPIYEPVDLQRLHLDFFWMQATLCDLIDERRDRAVRRCFATMNQLFISGDREIRTAVLQDFFFPDLVHHDDLAWARARMPRYLGRVFDAFLERLDSELPE
jgi:hypothetical protein